jgi:hypothetical protein
MPETILIGKPETAPARGAATRPAESLGPAIAAIGAAIALIGWADVILLWFPPDPGSPEWELGSLSATFESLPLATLGFSALILGLAAARARFRLLAAGIASWITTFALAGALALLLLNLPIALRMIAPELRVPMQIALAKSLGMAVIYVALYASLGWFALRRFRRSAGAAT